MKYTNVQSPTWNKDKTAINCWVTFDELGTLPFSAVPRDRYPHVVEIYDRCVAGEFGPVADYVPASDEGPQEPGIPAHMAIPVSINGEIL